MIFVLTGTMTSLNCINVFIFPVLSYHFQKKNISVSFSFDILLVLCFRKRFKIPYIVRVVFLLCWYSKFRNSVEIFSLYRFISFWNLIFLSGNMQPEFIAKRRFQLQEYLNALLMNPILASSLPAKKFVDPESYNQSFHGNIFVS